MPEFKLKIAGHTAAVTALFDSTPLYLHAYLTQDEAETGFSVTREDLVFEQEDSIREAKEEGIRVRLFPDPYLERAAIQRKWAEYLFPRGILLFHGSAVAVDGEGYLFTARCGTGKSTHTRLWRQVFGQRAVMINDDKPFLRLLEENVLVCGSPWSGKHGLHTNLSVPLKGICILERGKENRIRSITPRQARAMLLKQSYCPLDPCRREAFEALVDRLAQQVPLWRMECNVDPHAALTAYRAMSGKTQICDTAL